MTVTFHQYQSSNLSKHVLHVVVFCMLLTMSCAEGRDQLLRTTMVGFLLKNSERNKLELEYHNKSSVWPGQCFGNEFDNVLSVIILNRWCTT